MLKLTRVEWFENPKSLSEIYQQTGMIFAFVTSPEDGQKACHEWVKCRDFMHDAVRSQITGKSCKIYGFQYDPGKNPNLDLNKMRMLVSKHDLAKDKAGSFKAKMKAALAMLNHFEAQAGVALSVLKEVDPEGSKKQAIFMFTGSTMWIKSPFLVSMYTFLIRLGDKELKFKDAADLREKFKALNGDNNAGKLIDNDAQYLGASWDKMHSIIENRTTLFPMKDGVHDIFHSEHNIDSFHNNAGIQSLALCKTPDKELNEKIKELTKR